MKPFLASKSVEKSVVKSYSEFRFVLPKVELNKKNFK